MEQKLQPKPQFEANKDEKFKQTTSQWGQTYLQPSPEQSPRQKEILDALQLAIYELNSAIATINNEPANNFPDANITVLNQYSRVVVFNNGNVFFEQVPNSEPTAHYIIAGPPGVACGRCGGSGTEPGRANPDDNQVSLE